MPRRRKDIVSALPPPPPFYKLFREDSALAPPPPPPPLVGDYQMYGSQYSTVNHVPSLESFGTIQLYDSEADPKDELRRLNHSLLFAFLQLVEVATLDPPSFPSFVERIHVILLNMHALVNEHRPRQARADLLDLLRQRVAARRELIDQLRSELEAARASVARAIDQAALAAAVPPLSQPGSPMVVDAGASVSGALASTASSTAVATTDVAACGGASAGASAATAAATTKTHVDAELSLQYRLMRQAVDALRVDHPAAP